MNVKRILGRYNHNIILSIFTFNCIYFMLYYVHCIAAINKLYFIHNLASLVAASKTDVNLIAKYMDKGRLKLQPSIAFK